MTYWCPGTELNRRHEDFQSSALPTELPGHPAGGRCGAEDNTRAAKTFRGLPHPVSHQRGQVAQRLRGGAEVGDGVERGLHQLVAELLRAVHAGQLDERQALRVLAR